MWMIQFNDCSFINGEDIVEVSGGSHGYIYFKLRNNEEYSVCSKHIHTFLNHLQALNKSITDLESTLTTME